MPRRTRNVRLSVRKKVETVDDDYNTRQPRYEHVRWQRFRLFPKTGEEFFEMDRAGYGATWEGETRPHPEPIQDGWILVSFVNDEVENVYTLSKSLRRGSKLHVLLEEKNPKQFGIKGPHSTSD